MILLYNNNFKMLFIILIQSIVYNVHCQNINKDSVNLYFQKIKTITDDTNKDFLKLNLSINKQDNAQLLYNYMDSITDDKPQLKLLFYYQNIGYLIRNNKLDEAIKKSSIGIGTAKKNKLNKKLFDLLKQKSFAFIIQTKIDSALHYANEAEKLIESNKAALYEELYQIDLLRTDIEGLMGNFNKRIYYYEKAVEHIEAYPKNKNIAYVLANTAYFFKSENNYEKHSIYSQKLKSYYQKKGGFNNPTKHAALSSYLEFENNEEQIEVLKALIDSSNISKLNIGQRLNINTLAESLISVGKPKQAIKYLKLNTSENNFPLVNKLTSYYYLEEAYKQIDDCDNTLKAVNQKVILIDSIRTQQMIAKIADSKVKYETEKKEAQLKLLKLEKEKEKQKNRLFIIIAFLGLGILILTSYFLYRNNKKSKQLNKQNMLLEKTVDEKNVLLREVHHRVKNSFQIVSSLLYLQSENITDPNAKFAIKEAQNRVRSMVLVHQRLYNNDELVGINTKDYFEDLIKDIFESHDIKEEPIAYNLNIESLVLDIETITPLGLILNELIINTMKHAFDGIEKNHKIDVDFVKVNDQLELRVTDNGKGFDGKVSDTSFGIVLMKALSKQLQASLFHNSGKNMGTEVKLIINKFNIL